MYFGDLRKQQNNQENFSVYPHMPARMDGPWDNCERDSSKGKSWVISGFWTWVGTEGQWPEWRGWEEGRRNGVISEVE